MQLNYQVIPEKGRRRVTREETPDVTEIHLLDGQVVKGYYCPFVVFGLIGLPVTTNRKEVTDEEDREDSAAKFKIGLTANEFFRDEDGETVRRQMVTVRIPYPDLTPIRNGEEVRFVQRHTLLYVWSGRFVREVFRLVEERMQSRRQRARAFSTSWRIDDATTSEVMTYLYSSGAQIAAVRKVEPGKDPVWHLSIRQIEDDDSTELLFRLDRVERGGVRSWPPKNRRGNRLFDQTGLALVQVDQTNMSLREELEIVRNGSGRQRAQLYGISA